MSATSTTTLTELVNSEFIAPAILDYAIDFTCAASFLRWQDLRGKGTKVGSFPRYVLDTAGDLGETTDLTTVTELETTDVQLTAAEIGLRRDVTDAAIEETIIGAALFDYLVTDAARLCAVSLDDDICALFPSFSNAVGQATTDLSIANMVQAFAQLGKNKMRGQGVYVLDDQQMSDYLEAAAASTSTTINGVMSVQTTPGSNYLGTFFNAEVWYTGLCDTSGTGASVNGAFFVRGDTDPTSAAIGGVLTRDVRLEQQRDASGRLTEVVVTAKWGVGEICDDSGVRIRTDA